MDLIEKAFCDIFPHREYNYHGVLKYSRRFNDYNANASRCGVNITVKLSYLWADVDEDIQIGLIQDLLTRLFKTNKDTQRMELYRIFIKKLGQNIPAENVDPFLEISFNRVNQKYFNSLMDMPNMRYGSDTIRTAGSYNFHTDTITISGLLRDAEDELIDLVMFHELLHKKMQYDHKVKRAIHHNRKFKELEASFDNYKEVEKKLKKHLFQR